MKISIIGAGNVGGTAAMRLFEANLGDIVLFDVAPGLAKAKVLDLEDSYGIGKGNRYTITGSQDIEAIKDSDIIVVTAGLARKPGMSREELLNKNAQILKGICLNIKKLSSLAVIIIVTNPLDLMTYLALKTTGFNRERVFGMGPSLDAGRFTNLISKELGIPPKDIDACVIASHGEGMLPLPRFSKVNADSLDKILDAEKLKILVKKTVERGHEIVSLLGNGSAYFAPSKAITEIVTAISKNEGRAIGVSAYLNGEYGLKGICIGTPCILGREGIKKVIELDLNSEEKAAFLRSAEGIRKNLDSLKKYI